MAIKRLDPAAKFKLVSQFDDAIVKSAERYDTYLESLNTADLQFAEGQLPTLFVVRPLTNMELAEFNSKYMRVDVMNKKIVYKDESKMFLEMFELCFEGVEEAGATLEKLPVASIPYPVSTEIGSIISLIAVLGKNLKKA